MWDIDYSSRQVEEALNEIRLLEPEGVRECLGYLQKSPLTRVAKKVYPMKGERFSGNWIFHISEKYKIIYVPISQDKKVLIDDAGEITIWP